MIRVGCDAEALTRADLLTGIRVEPTAGSTSMEAALEAAGAYAAMGGRSSMGATRTRMPKETRAGPVQMGAGMLAMPSRLVEKIMRDEYVDLAEFPPAAPEGVSPVAHMSDQVLIVQAADLKKSRHNISDITVWARCFLLFIKVVEVYRPKRVPDLLGYMDIILRTSQRFPGLTMMHGSGRQWQGTVRGNGQHWMQACTPSASPRKLGDGWRRPPERKLVIGSTPARG